jgi:hypothetical protein
MTVALALCAVVLSGAGLANAGLPRATRALKVAVALTLGLGTWSAAYAAQWMAFGARGTGWKDAALCALGVLLLIAFAKPRVETGAVEAASLARADATPRDRWLVLLFAAACAISAAAYVEHTIRLPDGGWDAWMTWNLRARFLVRAADARDAFSPDMLYWAHQEYPWLLPGVVAQVFLLFGESYVAPAVVGFVFGALLIAVLVAALARLEGRRTALLGGLVLCSTPCFATFASNQQSDVPLALFLFTAVALLELGRGQPRALALAGFAAGLCAWTKNEGTFYVLCVVAALVLFRREAVLPFVLGALPGLVLLVAFKLGVAPPSPLGEPGLAGRLLDPRRWLELLQHVVRRAFYFQAWGLWVLAWLGALWLARRELRRSPLALSLFLWLAFCGVTYLAVPYPLHWIFKSSADRLFLQLWPAAILLTLPALSRATART